MIEPEDKIAAVIDAAGGTLVSRVRLQKTVYLLDQLGLNSGFDYEYHHYGPYSRELDIATSDAKALGVVEEKIKHRAGDGASYSTFTIPTVGSSKDQALGKLSKIQTAELVKKFTQTHVTVLELAATAHWLWKYEKCEDWQAEIAKRKPMKVGGDRLKRAVDLLHELNLSPPEATRRRAGGGY
jgi:uncharacterized protein YwgA